MKRLIRIILDSLKLAIILLKVLIRARLGYLWLTIIMLELWFLLERDINDSRFCLNWFSRYRLFGWQFCLKTIIILLNTMLILLELIICWYRMFLEWNLFYFLTWNRNCLRASFNQCCRCTCRNCYWFRLISIIYYQRRFRCYYWCSKFWFSFELGL